VFEHIGLFDPGVQLTKGSVGSVEDDEIERRLWRAGRLGLYDPGVVVHADVQPERMTRDYHRRWHRGHGRYYAIMQAEDVERSSLRLFDVPGPLYRQAAADTLGWLKSSLGAGGGGDAFCRETRLRFFLGFFQKRREDFRAAGSSNDLREVAAFVRALVSEKKRRGGASEKERGGGPS
jgi:glucosyl-dolichyl phosphate glucuronosyltransferase